MTVADLVDVFCLLDVLSSIFCGAVVLLVVVVAAGVVVVVAAAVVVVVVVPVFNLNQVSPVQACPCKTRFC